MTKAIRTNKKKRNNVVIIIDAQDCDEMETIKKDLLLSVRRVARKQEVGYYITPVQNASLETIQDFANFSLKIFTGSR